MALGKVGAYVHTHTHTIYYNYVELIMCFCDYEYIHVLQLKDRYDILPHIYGKKFSKSNIAKLCKEIARCEL